MTSQQEKTSVCCPNCLSLYAPFPLGPNSKNPKKHSISKPPSKQAQKKPRKKAVSTSTTPSLSQIPVQTEGPKCYIDDVLDYFIKLYVPWHSRFERRLYKSKDNKPVMRFTKKNEKTPPQVCLRLKWYELSSKWQEEGIDIKEISEETAQLWVRTEKEVSSQKPRQGDPLKLYIENLNPRPGSELTPQQIAEASKLNLIKKQRPRTLKLKGDFANMLKIKDVLPDAYQNTRKNGEDITIERRIAFGSKSWPAYDINLYEMSALQDAINKTNKTFSGKTIDYDTPPYEIKEPHDLFQVIGWDIAVPKAEEIIDRFKKIEFTVRKKGKTISIRKFDKWYQQTETKKKKPKMWGPVRVRRYKDSHQWEYRFNVDSSAIDLIDEACSFYHQLNPKLHKRYLRLSIEETKKKSKKEVGFDKSKTDKSWKLMSDFLEDPKAVVAIIGWGTDSKKGHARWCVKVVNDKEKELQIWNPHGSEKQVVETMKAKQIEQITRYPSWLESKINEYNKKSKVEPWKLSLKNKDWSDQGQEGSCGPLAFARAINVTESGKAESALSDIAPWILLVTKVLWNFCQDQMPNIRAIREVKWLLQENKEFQTWWVKQFSSSSPTVRFDDIPNEFIFFLNQVRANDRIYADIITDGQQQKFRAFLASGSKVVAFYYQNELLLLNKKSAAQIEVWQGAVKKKDSILRKKEGKEVIKTMIKKMLGEDHIEIQPKLGKLVKSGTPNQQTLCLLYVLSYNETWSNQSDIPAWVNIFILQLYLIVKIGLQDGLKLKSYPKKD